ncbi:MAG: hypothetical protein J7K66_02830 [Anaerolineaceae bacterium]|nr:hypothetical protein [Anaerolineaceae bacterium]
MADIIIKKKRARRRYWISAFLLMLYALVGWLRLQQTLLYWYYFLKLGLWPHPFYLAVSGGAIGFGYTLALVFHLVRFKYTAYYIHFLGILLVLWIWLDRIWIARRDSFISLLPITVIITCCTIGLDLLLIRKIKYKK